jgi:hypothetical protein
VIALTVWCTGRFRLIFSIAAHICIPDTRRLGPSVHGVHVFSDNRRCIVL